MRAVALAFAVFVLALFLAACATAQAFTANGVTPASTSTTSASPGSPDWEHPDRSCKVDADCQAKNVGNCCGVHRECVNKDAPTDPAKVKALCSQDRRAGVCSTRYIGECSCSQGQCHVPAPATTPKFP
jgi:hypothetical protein